MDTELTGGFCSHSRPYFIGEWFKCLKLSWCLDWFLTQAVHGELWHIWWGYYIVLYYSNICKLCMVTFIVLKAMFYFKIALRIWIATLESWVLTMMAKCVLCSIRQLSFNIKHSSSHTFCVFESHLKWIDIRHRILDCGLVEDWSLVASGADTAQIIFEVATVYEEADFHRSQLL